MEKFDAIILGFGKGGKTLAADLAARAWRVAIVERSPKMYGGTCINIGCIPTKTLVHDAKIAAQQHFASFDEKRAFYRNAIARKEQVVATLRDKNYHMLADQPNITVYTGEGSFLSSDRVAVTTASERIELQSEHIFINTGSETILPNIEGITDNHAVYTSTSMLELADLPERLTIIGGGYIGLEFASMYASFGSEVTVMESGPTLIVREDRDVATAVREALEAKGITFVMNARVESIHQNVQGETTRYLDTLTGAQHFINSDAVLLATGRRAATASLHLEAAGVAVNERGAIVVDDRLRTTHPSIRAMGDVKGGLQFTYISLDDYRIIRDDLFGSSHRTSVDRMPMSYSVFIDPPLSRIGLNEDEARQRGINYRVKSIPVTAIPRAKTLNESRGLLKALIDAERGEILGCTLFCPESSEIINSVAMAMKMHQKADFLHDFIFTHPSMSEALNDLFA